MSRWLDRISTTPIGTCGRNSPFPGCASALFPTNGIEFSSVCGRVITIQYGSLNAFDPYHNFDQRTIDDYYVDGVSITYGNPRQHVWTFAAHPGDDYTNPNALCPCSQPSLSVPSPPSFVGNSYFCDTGAPPCCFPTLMTPCGMDRVVVVLVPVAHSIILRGSWLLCQKLPLMILKYEPVTMRDLIRITHQ